MGWRSTIWVSREEAENMYVELKMHEDNIKRQFKAEAVLLNDEELGDAIDPIGEMTGMGYYGYNFLVGKDYEEDNDGH